MLRDPDLRERLVADVGDRDFTLAKEAVKKSFFDRLVVMEDAGKLSRSLADVAVERGVHPVEAMIDLGLESDFGVFFFQPTSNDDPGDVQRILDHPRTVMTFSDAGAHVSQIMNASLPTHLLSVWVRNWQVFTLEQAVRMLTLVPSTVWGFADRGLLREGFVADLNVIDPESVAAHLPRVERDLPGGAARLTQRAVRFPRDGRWRPGAARGRRAHGRSPGLARAPRISGRALGDRPRDVSSAEVELDDLDVVVVHRVEVADRRCDLEHRPERLVLIMHR